MAIEWVCYEPGWHITKDKRFEIHKVDSGKWHITANVKTHIGFSEWYRTLSDAKLAVDREDGYTTAPMTGSKASFEWSCRYLTAITVEERQRIREELAIVELPPWVWNSFYKKCIPTRDVILKEFARLDKDRPIEDPVVIELPLVN